MVSIARLKIEWQSSSALPLATLGWGYLAYTGALRALNVQTPPVCLFHLITGTPCPLCGMTRAFGCLMVGDSTGAVQLNTFAIPAFILWLSMSFLFALMTYDALKVGRVD